MNDNFQDEWLSAFLDGEATPEERAEVERRLNASPEIRQELEDLTDVSQLLRELPQCQAPEELRSAVLQAAERATLLPPAAPPAKRGWKPAAISLATSAAAVLVLVFVWQGGAPEHATDATIPLAQEQARLEMDFAHTDQVQLGPSEPESTAIALRSSADARESSVAAPAAASSATPAEPTEASGRAVVSRGNARLVFDAEDLNGAHVGDVIQAIDNSGEELTVVKLTVVDRQEGLETLQFLLSKNQIHNDSAAPKNSAIPSTDHIVAVYVESSRTQLAVALEEFMREQQFQTLEVEGPIRIASLHPDSQARIGLSGPSEADGEQPSSPEPSARAARAQEKVVADVATEKTPRADRSQSRPEAAPRKSVASRQKQLLLPAELLESELHKIAMTSRSRLQKGRAADQVALRSAPLHVLFVIVGEKPAGGPSPAPPEPADGTKAPRPLPFRRGAA